jgi:hypothetical protein
VRSFFGRDSGPPDDRCGVGRQRTVTDGRVQHRPQDCVRGPDRGLGQPLAAELDHPPLDMRRPELVQRQPPDRAGDDVRARDAGVHDLGRLLALGGLQRGVDPVQREGGDGFPPVSGGLTAFYPSPDRGRLVPGLLRGLPVDGVAAALPNSSVTRRLVCQRPSGRRRGVDPSLLPRLFAEEPVPGVRGLTAGPSRRHQTTSVMGEADAGRCVSTGQGRSGGLWTKSKSPPWFVTVRLRRCGARVGGGGGGA